MKVAIPYESLLDKYTSQIQEIVTKLRHGTSASRDMHPEELFWFWDWGVTVQTLTFAELIRTGPLVWKNPAEMTKKEFLKDYASKCCVSLTAEMGRGRWTSNTTIDPVPQEVLDIGLNDWRYWKRVAKNKLTQPFKNPYTQCLLRHGLAIDKNLSMQVPLRSTVTWLPTKFAKKGKQLRLKDERGVWQKWEVAETYSTMEYDYLREHERDHLKAREASDI